jgi:hypothetical protein
MKRTSGRNIYVIDVKRVVGSQTPQQFADASSAAHLSGVWIRVGRGTTKDRNLSYPPLAAISEALAKANVELWGWHVPFCPDLAQAKTEAAQVLSWVDQAHLAGIVVDAERTKENPRFQGQVAEAVAYTEALVAGLANRNCGIAFSSHDQPALHTDMPFRPFLDQIEDACPQVYYRSAHPLVRISKSEHDYKPLLTEALFKSRYKPTGNITMGDDLPFPDVQTCLNATTAFLQHVATAGYASHSFWCWDTAPKEIWPLLQQTPA